MYNVDDVVVVKNALVRFEHQDFDFDNGIYVNVGGLNVDNRKRVVKVMRAFGFEISFLGDRIAVNW